MAINKIVSASSVDPSIPTNQLSLRSGLIDAVSEWDFSLTSGSACADQIGSNDISFLVAPTVVSEGISCSADVEGTAGILLPEAYSVAYVFERSSGNGVPVGGSAFSGSNYYNGLFGNYYLLTHGTSRQYLIDDYTAGEFRFALHSVDAANGKRFCQVSRRFERAQSSGTVYAHPGSGIELTFGRAKGINGTQLTGTICWAVYFDRFIDDPRQVKLIYEYAKSLVAAKGVSI